MVDQQIEQIPYDCNDIRIKGITERVVDLNLCLQCGLMILAKDLKAGRLRL
jgi:hypothetical protein